MRCGLVKGTRILDQLGWVRQQQQHSMRSWVEGAQAPVEAQADVVRGVLQPGQVRQDTHTMWRLGGG